MISHLLNFAATPAAGTYTARRVSGEEFGNLVRAAAARQRLHALIGYDGTADIVELLAGVPIRVTRDRLHEIDDGDEILLVQLRPRPRGEKTTRDVILRVADFDYFHIEYRA